MLTQKRRLDVGQRGKLGVFEREARDGHLAQNRVRDRPHHLARLEIGMLQNVGDGHDRRRRHAVILENLEDRGVARLRLHPGFDDRDEGVLVLAPVGVGRKPLVVDQLGFAHRLAHIGPLPVEHENDDPAVGPLEHAARTHQRMV